MKKILIIIAIFFLVLMMVSCNAGSEKYDGEQHKAGFWSGLWHGLISLITFIISIFNKNVEIYEANNVGVWYDLGFILGVSIFFGSSSSTVKFKNKEERFSKYKNEISSEIKKEILKSIDEWADDVDDSEKYENKKDISDNIQEKIKKNFNDWENKR